MKSMAEFWLRLSMSTREWTDNPQILQGMVLQQGKLLLKAMEILKNMTTDTTIG